MKKILIISIFVLISSSVKAGENLPIYAVGDIHGDLKAFQLALRVAGLVDLDGNWIGGRARLVQTGDFTDRGNDEVAIFDYLEKLESQAAQAGGRVFVLIGNHEFINVDGIFPFVTKKGFEDFDILYPQAIKDPALAHLKKHRRARTYAFSPGGPFAKKLSRYPVILILEGNLFVHGGINDATLDYGIDRINEELALWLQGEIKEAPRILRASKNPMWNRLWSKDAKRKDCPVFARLLDKAGVKRIVVGHTVQKHINSICDGRVWRIDTGIAESFAGNVEVLRILGDDVSVIKGPQRRIRKPNKNKDKENPGTKRRGRKNADAA